MKSQPLALENQEKQTRQRQEILRIMQTARGPLSSFEIHRLARQTLSRIGLATIYRTLKILQRDGNVRSVILPDGVTRFESASRGQNHFQCRSCRQIWTLHDEPRESEKLSNSVEEFVIEDHNTTFYGYCPICKKKAFAPTEI